MKTRLINKLETFFRTDIRYIVRGGFWLTVAKILSTVASLISSVAFANLLPEETYGVFRYVLSIAMILAIPTLHGLETALARSAAKGSEADFEVALRARLRFGSLGAAASALVAGYYYLSGDTTLALSFLIVTVFVPFMDSFHLYASLLNGKKKFQALARDEVATRMSVALLLALIVYFTDNVLVILGAFFATTTFLRLFFLMHTMRTVSRNNVSDPELIPYGKHLTAMGIFGRVATQVDKILVFHYVGGAALAAFYLAFMPMKLTQNILNGLSTLAMPKFSNNTEYILHRTLPKKILRLYLIIIPIVITFEFTAYLFFNLLFPKYPESIFMSQLLFLQLLFFPISLLSTAITALKKEKRLYINSSLPAFLRVGLLFSLVPFYGALGAIYSILITSLLSSSLLIYLFYKK